MVNNVIVNIRIKRIAIRNHIFLKKFINHILFKKFHLWFKIKYP